MLARLVLWMMLVAVVSWNGIREDEAAREAGTDSLGDPLPQGATGRLGTVRLRHGDEVTCFALTPDGRAIVSVDRREGTLIVWDSTTGRRLRDVGKHLGVYALAFSPDGKILASAGSDGRISLWDFALGKELHEMRTEQRAEYIYGLCFSPDGKLLACSGAMAHLWDVATGQRIHRFIPSGKSGEFITGTHAVAFSPDGKLLAAWSRDYALLWETETRKELARLRIPFRSLNCTAVLFLDNRPLLLGTWDGLHRVWDINARKDLLVLGPSSAAGTMRRATLSPDGKTLAIGEEGGLIRLREMETGKETAKLGPHIYRVTALEFSRDGKTLVSAEKTVRLWDTASGKERIDLPGHLGTVSSLAFSPVGKVLASGSQDSTIRFWDLASRKELDRRIDGRSVGINQGIASVRFSPNGKTLASVAAFFFGDVHYWDATTGKAERRLTWPTHETECLAYSADGALVAVGRTDRQILIHDAATGKERHVLGGKEGFPVQVVAFSPNRKLLASAGAGYTVRLWNLDTGKEEQRLGKDLQPALQDRGFIIETRYLAFSASGRTLTAIRSNGNLHQWDVTTGKLLRSLNGPPAPIVTSSPDGTLVASGLWEGKVVLWDARTGAEVRQLIGHQGQVTALAFSPDGKQLASGSADTTILLWDTGNRRKAK